MKTVDVIIADDHPIVRRAVIDSFRDISHIRFTGEANDGKELFELLKKSIPDIAIIDLEMPGMNGYDAILELHTRHPGIKIIVFSGFLEPAVQQKAINMGACATVSKSEPSQVLVEAIEAVVKGKTYHSRTIDDCGARKQKNPSYDRLTLREKQILDLIAEGKTSKQISEIYNISQWTVNKHRSNIKEKLKIRNLAEMIKFAINSPGKN